jgi:hypothetical protein
MTKQFNTWNRSFATVKNGSIGADGSPEKTLPKITNRGRRPQQMHWLIISANQCIDVLSKVEPKLTVLDAYLQSLATGCHGSTGLGDSPSKSLSITRAPFLAKHFQHLIALLVTCVIIPGCLLNAVHPITRVPRQQPDSAHAIVVIGLGLDAVLPFAEFAVTLDEYSVKKRDISGNCFHYNRIDATRMASVGNVAYFAFDVPAGTYVYSRRNAYATLDPPAMGSGLIASPGKTVYFGNYVFVGNKTVDFRRDIEAARLGSREFLPRDALLETAEPTTTVLTHPFLCTP